MKILMCGRLLLSALVLVCVVGCASFKSRERQSPVPPPVPENASKDHEQSPTVSKSHFWHIDKGDNKDAPRHTKRKNQLNRQPEETDNRASLLLEQDMVKEDIEEFEDIEELQARFDVPIETNDYVMDFVKYFQGPKRDWMTRTLRRGGRYLPQMQVIFREAGLPEDLVYLALIESGFNPYAYSPAGAAGIWQFIPSTGIRYGLRINWWIDERRDPEKSTRAAARYLRDLYDRFGDWHLAAAAYNCGEGRIERAMAQYSVDSFWHLLEYPCLRTETKEYVPKYIAAMMIAKEPERYGFEVDRPDIPLRYETVEIPNDLLIRSIAEACDTEPHVLLGMNPELRQACTPKGYRLKVPCGKQYTLLQSLPTIEPYRHITYRRHTVRKGESLASISRRYGTSVASIRRANKLKSTYKPRAKQSLVIPVVTRTRDTVGEQPELVATSVRETSSPAASPTETTTEGTRIVHKVRKGDTLSNISKRYGVTVSSIRQWNGTAKVKNLRAGQQLVLWINEPKDTRLAKSSGRKGDPSAPSRRQVTYVVKSGDTLWDIARRYEVTAADIISWNDLDIQQPLRRGDQLLLYSPIHVNAKRSEPRSQSIED